MNQLTIFAYETQPIVVEGLAKVISGCEDMQYLGSASSLSEALEFRTLLSTTWYVSTTGSNSNPGSINAPFLTIQNAANHAEPGDIVKISASLFPAARPRCMPLRPCGRMPARSPSRWPAGPVRAPRAG